VIPLEQLGLDYEEETPFCLYWEPLLDQLKLQVKGAPTLWNISKLTWRGSFLKACCP